MNNQVCLGCVVAASLGKRLCTWVYGAKPSPRLMVVRGGSRGAAVVLKKLLVNDSIQSSDRVDDGDFADQGFAMFVQKAGRDIAAVSKA